MYVYDAITINGLYTCWIWTTPHSVPTAAKMHATTPRSKEHSTTKSQAHNMMTRNMTFHNQEFVDLTAQCSHIMYTVISMYLDCQASSSGQLKSTVALFIVTNSECGG